MDKKCNKCGNNKSLLEFDKDKTHKDGHTTVCKECKINYRMANKNHVKAKNKKYYKDNKESLILKVKEYYKNNKELKKVYNKKYNIINSEKIKNNNAKYYKENKIIINKKNRLYEKNKLNSDNLYKLKHNVKTIIRNSIKENGFIKSSRTYEILGCSFIEFKTYLESKFKSWMKWDNHGKYNGELNYGWDIDHKIPLSSAKTEEELLKLCHYTNLQPLCSKVNRDVKRHYINLKKD